MSGPSSITIKYSPSSIIVMPVIRAREQNGNQWHDLQPRIKPDHAQASAGASDTCRWQRADGNALMRQLVTAAVRSEIRACFHRGGAISRE
jgi:hypothetical protein